MSNKNHITTTTTTLSNLSSPAHHHNHHEPFISSSACIRAERLYRIICRRLGHSVDGDVDEAIARDLRFNGALVVDLDLSKKEILNSIIGLLKEAPTIYQLLLYSGTYFFGNQPAYKDQVKSLRRRLKYNILTETDLIRQLIQSVSIYLQSSILNNNVLVIDLTGVPLKPITSSTNNTLSSNNSMGHLTGTLRTTLWKSSGPLEDLLHALKSCKKLQRLSLANCQLSDKGLQLLAPIIGKDLPKLDTLCIAKNRLIRPARALRRMFNLREVSISNNKATRALILLDIGRNPLGCGEYNDYNRLQLTLMEWCGLMDNNNNNHHGLEILKINGCRLERIDIIIQSLKNILIKGKDKENSNTCYTLPRIKEININNNPSLTDGTQTELDKLLSDISQLRGGGDLDINNNDNMPSSSSSSSSSTSYRGVYDNISTPTHNKVWYIPLTTRSLDNTYHRIQYNKEKEDEEEEYHCIIRDAISEGYSDNNDEDEDGGDGNSRELFKYKYNEYLNNIKRLMDIKYPHINNNTDNDDDYTNNNNNNSRPVVLEDERIVSSSLHYRNSYNDIMNSSFGYNNNNELINKNNNDMLHGLGHGGEGGEGEGCLFTPREGSNNNKTKNGEHGDDDDDLVMWLPKVIIMHINNNVSSIISSMTLSSSPPPSRGLDIIINDDILSVDNNNCHFITPKNTNNNNNDNNNNNNNSASRIIHPNSNTSHNTTIITDSSCCSCCSPIPTTTKNRRHMSSSSSCSSSPSTIWPWKTGLAFHNNTSLLRSSPTPSPSSIGHNLKEADDEYCTSTPTSSSSPSSSSLLPSPHTKLLLKNATDRITNDYMILLKVASSSSDNGGSSGTLLPPLVVNSGLTNNNPIVKRSRSWRVEALYDTNVQKVLDKMKIRQNEYHRKLEDAINKRKGLLNDITSDKLNAILRQLNALSDKVEEASIMIDERWKDRIRWQKQKRQDTAIAKASRKRKIAFQKGGILNNPNNTKLESVIEDSSSDIIYNDNIKYMIANNDDYIINTQSLLSLSDDHWSYFEQYLRLDNDNATTTEGGSSNNNNTAAAPGGGNNGSNKMDIRRRRLSALANCLMDLHKRAINRIESIGGCNEAILMLMEDDNNNENGNDDNDNNNYNEDDDDGDELYYDDDENEEVLSKYCEVLVLASQRMHILLCIMKALAWEKRMRSLPPYGSSNNNNILYDRSIGISFEDHIYKWFDTELQIAKASAQEYSHICVDHIHDLLTSIDNTYSSPLPRRLLQNVESSAQAYSHHLNALTQFLDNSDAPIGEEGLPLLWLLHELEQFKLNSSIKIKQHIGEDIKRSCALIRLILLLIPSGEYRYHNHRYNNNKGVLKGTPSIITYPHSGTLIEGRKKGYYNEDYDDDDKENCIDNNIMRIS